MCKVQISKSGLTPFSFKIVADDLNLNAEFDEINFEDVIFINGEIIDGGKAFEVKGKIKCRRSFICDRCLTQSTQDQVYEFDEELEIEEIEDNIADLNQIVRDTIIASQPIKNLCREDCKGLCSICGKNLNEGDCNCDRFVADPRLEVLKNLKIEE